MQVRSVDRLFLQAYVPKLMTLGDGRALPARPRQPIPSPVLLGKLGRAYIEAIERFAAEREIPIVRFSKGESKEESARKVGRCSHSMW